MRWRQQDGVRWLSAELPAPWLRTGLAAGPGEVPEAGIEVAFTGRGGGVSEPPFDGLNLGFHTDDEPTAVAANRGRLCRALRIDPGSVVAAHQVHGAAVEVHRRLPPNRDFLRPGGGGEGLPQADGQVVATVGGAEGEAASTAASWLAPLVLVADCLPVAIAGPGGIGMLHCGWRPLVAGIIGAGTTAIAARAAAIGPGIGPCCFEVGEEVHAAFAGFALGPGIKRGRNLDLPEIAARLLARAGVTHIERSGICTRCDADNFYSHRRDGARAGRQAGLVWRKADG